MAKTTTAPRLSDRYANAMVFAFEVHLYQIRKDPRQTPYIAHCQGVATYVLEDGGSEDEAIAALTHDAPEDQDMALLETIRERWGDNVASIVQACTEDKTIKDYRDRKLHYALQIDAAGASAVKVSLADKLHTLHHSFLVEARGGSHDYSPSQCADVIWFYQTLVPVYRKYFPHSHLLAQLVTDLSCLEALWLAPVHPVQLG